MIGRSRLDAARKRCTLTNEEQEVLESLLGTTQGMLTLELDKFPRNFLKSLFEDNKLKPNQRAVLALHVHGIQNAGIDRGEIYELSVSSPVEFGSTFAMFGRKQPNAELR